MTRSDEESALVTRFRTATSWWREACDDVWSAYWAWVECDSGEGGLRFAAYQSALDREENTAVIHHERARRLSTLALERCRTTRAST
jgi:hypothetical protein